MNHTFSVRTRLIIQAVLLTLIASIDGLLGLHGLAIEKERFETVNKDRVGALVQLTGVLYDTLSIHRQLDLAQAAGTRPPRNDALDEIVRLDAARQRAWDTYLNTRMTPRERQIVEVARTRRAALATARSNVIEAFRLGGAAAGQRAMATTGLDAQYDAFSAAIRQLIDLQASVTQQEYEASQQSYRRLWLVMIATTALCGVWALGTALLLARSIIRPLRIAMSAADSIAEGNFTTSLPDGGGDEFGQLLRSLTRMRDSLRSMSDEIRARIRQLEDMSNGLPVAVYQMRLFPDGRHAYTFVSRRATEIIGVPADELLREPEARWRHVHPGDREKASEAVLDLIRRAQASGPDAWGEAEVRLQFEGRPRTVLAVAYAARSQADGTVTFNGYYQDITEQRRAQRLLQDVLDESPSVVFVKDPAGRLLLTNRAFDQLFGLPPGGALGKTDFELFPHEVAERIRSVDRNVLATTQVQQFEEEIPASGGVCSFLTIKFPLLDESGLPYALCGIANDISERRAAEMRLRDSEAYNKVLFDESHVPILVVDPDTGEYLDCNRAAVAIHGFTSRDELLGKRSLDLSAPVQAGDIAAITALKERLATGQENASEAFEWRYRRPDGEIWDSLVHKTAFRHGGRLLLQATLEDITMRKRAGQAIRDARQAAEDAARAKSDFLATMSHEIRTPLTAILGNLELLGRSPLTEMQNDRLRTITDSSRTLLDIIDDILDFSKVESGQLRLEQIPFDMVETVEQAVELFGPAARNKGLTLCLSSAPELGRSYYGDPARIRQIVVNLVSNAIKFTGSGSVSVDVRACGEPSAPSTLMISVQDTGIGIPAAIQGELFEPFRQADSSVTRRFGGTGLGLALCKRLAELMGGAITLTSAVGRGSQFVVRLPLLTDSDGLIGGWYCNDGSLIALAGDSPEWLASLAPHLAAWGLKVRPVTSKADLPPVPVPLLIVGAAPFWTSGDDVVSGAPARWIIAVDAEGPRDPIAAGSRVRVSSFSLDGIRRAVAGAIQGHLPARLPAGASSATTGRQETHPTVRVLVAEDHPAIRALFADQLEALGYDADFAENGAVALTRFDSHRYDIVLTDLSMPVLDGYALAARLRAQDVLVPIIAVTAHTTASELARCTAVGINDVLLKPFSMENLKAVMQKHTRERIVSPLTTSPVSNPEASKRLPPAFFEALATASRQSLDTISDALARNDAPPVLQELHSIRGAFMMAQRPDVAAACRRLEELARNDDLAALREAWPSLQRMIEEALQSQP